MDYSIEEIIAIARACGIECELNSDNPGVYIIRGDGRHETLTLWICLS